MLSGATVNFRRTSKYVRNTRVGGACLRSRRNVDVLPDPLCNLSGFPERISLFRRINPHEFVSWRFHRALSLSSFSWKRISPSVGSAFSYRKRVVRVASNPQRSRKEARESWLTSGIYRADRTCCVLHRSPLGETPLWCKRESHSLSASFLDLGEISLTRETSLQSAILRAVSRLSE